MEMRAPPSSLPAVLEVMLHGQKPKDPVFQPRPVVPVDHHQEAQWIISTLLMVVTRQLLQDPRPTRPSNALVPIALHLPTLPLKLLSTLHPTPRGSACSITLRNSQVIPLPLPRESPHRAQLKNPLPPLSARTLPPLVPVPASQPAVKRPTLSSTSAPQLPSHHHSPSALHPTNPQIQM